MKMNRNNMNTKTRTGFTLIELLVVIAIILILTAAAIPTVRFLTKDRKVREASRMVSSYVESAREEAKSTGRPAGVWFERSDNDLNKCVRIYRTKIPPSYSGDLSNEPVWVDDQGGSELALVRRASNSLLESGSIRAGDEIRFDNKGVWYPIYLNPFVKTFPTASATDYEPPVPGDYFAIPFRKQLYTGTHTQTGQDLSQLPRLPTVPEGPISSYQIRRQPTKKSSSFIDLPVGTFVDLAHSGLAVTNFSFGVANRGYILRHGGGGGGTEFCSRNDTLTHSGGTDQISPKTGPVLLMFNETGSVSDLYFEFYKANFNSTAGEVDDPNVWSPAAPTRFIRPAIPLRSTFFLVAADNLSDESEGVDNLNFNSNLWVSVSRNGGKVTVAPAAPSAITSTVADDNIDVNGNSMDYFDDNTITRAERIWASRIFATSGVSEPGN